MQTTLSKYELSRAREIRNAMTSPLAGYLRRSRLPKSATLRSIGLIYRAARSTGNWTEARETDLYIKDGNVYCAILEYIHLAYGPARKMEEQQ